MKTLVQHSEVVKLSLDVEPRTSDENHPYLLDTLKDLLPDSPPRKRGGGINVDY